MKKLKQNRVASFAIVTLVYIIATIVGIAVYEMLELAWWLSLLLADVAATVVTFLFSVIFENASVYDPYWSVQPIVIVWAAIIANGGTSAGGWLIAAAISFWGVRLTANWAYTFGGLNHQDWRYTMLCERTGVFYPLINFFFYLLICNICVK